MTNAQPDKTGLHILLKLAALVVIPRGYSCRGRYHRTASAGPFLCHRIESAGHLVYSPGSTSASRDNVSRGGNADRSYGVSRRSGIVNH
ncbi:Uncharacterised protein [Citrobacter freundii]|nr:Uncharacterised protein [Citrobacter freundii]